MVGHMSSSSTTTSNSTPGTVDMTGRHDSSTVGERIRLADQRRPSYDSVSVLRKQWMVVTMFLVFIPAMILVCITGPVYQNEGGRAREWDPKQRYLTAIAGAIFMAVGLLRLFAMPETA